MTTALTDTELEGKLQQFQGIAARLNRLRKDASIRAAAELRTASTALLHCAEQRVDAANRLLEMARKLHNQVRNL